MGVLFGTGTGLAAEVDFAVSGVSTGLAVGDFNGDGFADFAVVGGLGTGAGRVEKFLWMP